MKDPKTKENGLWKGISRCGPIVLAAVVVLLSTGVANAGCFTKPVPAKSRSNAVQSPPGQSAAQDGAAAPAEFIVGLWYTTYLTDDGQVFQYSLDQWHSDGTEFENAYVTPLVGNICLGAWKKTGPSTVQLTHYGWNFDQFGNPAGYFTLTEVNTLGSKDTYSGTFVFKVYDDGGQLLQTIEGTQSATRIKP